MFFFGWVIFDNLFRAEVLVWGMIIIALLALESLLVEIVKVQKAMIKDGSEGDDQSTEGEIVKAQKETTLSQQIQAVDNVGPRS